MSTPSQYQRQDPFQVQLEKQNNESIKLAATKKIAADKAKKQQALSFTKSEADRLQLAKILGERNYAKIQKDLKQATDNALSPSSDYGTNLSPAEIAYLTNLENALTAQGNEVVSITQQYLNNYNQRITLEKELNPKPNTKKLTDAKATGAVTKAATNPTPTGTPATNDFTYYYNAPMVKYAYLSAGSSPDSPSPQQKNISSSLSGPGHSSTINAPWAGLVASKGLLRMDMDNAITTANSSAKNSAVFDNNLYGFQFLYNPKEVAMTWAVAEGMNLEGLQANLDPGSAPTMALAGSTISFSLLLNRTLDMSYLDSNGLKDGVINPYPSFNSIRSYSEEFKNIYEKGTMYDLEYLFRTMSGTNADFNSGINGWTADRGWLYGMAVELHLGNRLRYRVRVSGLDVTHAIFDERMVPILTYVNITCSRFNYISQN